MGYKSLNKDGLLIAKPRSERRLPRGHRMTVAERNNIIQMYNDDSPLAEISSVSGFSIATISKIIRESRE